MNELDKFLCELSDLEKLRVCNLIMKSSHFDGKVNFLGRNSEIKHGHCKEKRISFESRFVPAAKKVFTEWMIDCDATFFAESRNSGSWYYISRAYLVPDEVFVFRGEKKDSDRPVAFENLSTNVRFHIPKWNPKS